MAYVLVTLFLIGIWLFCLLDVLQTDASEMRHLSKSGWFIVTLLGFLLGALLWLLDGRPRHRPTARTAWSPVTAEGPIGPDDDPAFLREIERRLRGDDGV
ncbi:PLDc N-terminal domain-containing protein [Actinomadura graeca]|uniref:PLDc N-terminal domain-containing protein n=1 Tax=Actinomadura graeca TaxID=2750812 RepID=A0ABX8QXT9_9ACTN|nr:PLDc N-terminal domain-containing protein [Actinomadura graeca]QXJ23552.1 PLDc N-terminal domain-containing protein [Actinomadura graeca]